MRGGVDVDDRDPRSRLGERGGGASGELVQIRRADLDDAVRTKRAECKTCKYDRVCEGVWGNYWRRRGWDEFVPVPA